MGLATIGIDALQNKIYVANFKHPIIFVNTANHAMAEHDANFTLWK